MSPPTWGWGWGSVSISRKEGVLPTALFLQYFTLQLQMPPPRNPRQVVASSITGPPRWSPAPPLPTPPTAQVRPADKFGASMRGVFSLHSCVAFLPSLLITEPCYVMETAKETSVCQALTQQDSSNQGVIPVSQEYKLRPRERKQKAPVSSSFGTQMCLQSPPASPSSPPAGARVPSNLGSTQLPCGAENCS